MNYIEEKLAQLQTHEEDLDRMPCGDERAEKVRLIDRARKEIMQMGIHKGRSIIIEERLNNLMEQLCSTTTN